MLPTFADDILTIATQINHIQIARENAYNQNSIMFKTTQRKRKIINLDSKRRKNITKTTMRVNFAIMKEKET